MKIRKTLVANVLAACGALSCGVALAQTNTLPSIYVSSASLANTNQPGFIWNISEVAATEPNLLNWAESQLAGLEGINLADPTSLGTDGSGAQSATALGIVSSNPNAPISFTIPGTINWAVSSTGRPELQPEGTFPGLPGTTGINDNTAGEALTYLLLPAGPLTMGVTSDDGFKLVIGAANPADRYSTNGLIVEQYNGGRGAADSIVTFIVPKAGLYAARLLYEDGGGSLNCEWYTLVGTNAVLINDRANGGIPAYAALTQPAGSYVSSALPAPNATGVSPVPVITAQIINGTVAVTNITLSFNGTPVTPTLTTTSNGVLVSYTITNFLAASSVNTVALGWTDNGNPQGLTWSFTTAGYVALTAAQAVTPDTTKPGFRFNIFENGLDVVTGDNDFFHNNELGLNGLEPSDNQSLSDGGVPNNPGLANLAAVSSVGPAITNAPALGGLAAPAEFQVAGAISLTNAFPGLPGTDGNNGPSHSEILTYVHLPVGLTTFNAKIDGWYRAFAGSWDYTLGEQAGTVNASTAGTVQFFVYAPVAGYYPLRLSYLNTDGTPTFVLSTAGTNGVQVSVGDTAHGGLAAYRALSTPAGPYVRFTDPRPVPRQVNVPSPELLIRLQDGDTAVNNTSPSLTLDGVVVPVSTNRVGDVLELTYTPTNLITVGEIHTAVLDYKDSAGKSYTNEWSFMNLKSMWIPTNLVPVDIETFDTYVDPTEFTNSPIPAVSFLSPLPTGVAANTISSGTNWFVWNFDASEGAVEDGKFDPTDPNSQAYANFLEVDAAAFAGIESDSANIAPFEILNGQPITQLAFNNILIAESDNRSGSGAGQVQFAVSRSFNLSKAANPVLVWSNLKKQNQDDFAGMEYTVDGGAHWAPVMYCLDGGKFGSDPADVVVNFDGTVNVAVSFAYSSDTPKWTDAQGIYHSTYGDAVAAKIDPALGPFFAPRINDDKFEGKRMEAVRLPLAAGKSDVRLRLGQLGTCSWYFGVDNLAIYDIPLTLPGAVVPTGLPKGTSGPQITSIGLSSGTLTITWTAGATIQLQQNSNLTSTNWVNVTGTLGKGTYSTTSLTGNTYYRLIQN